jgi:hypothetical protein
MYLGDRSGDKSGERLRHESLRQATFTALRLRICAAVSFANSVLMPSSAKVARSRCFVGEGSSAVVF